MNATKINATSSTSFAETENKDSAKDVQQPVANKELDLKERLETVEMKLKEGEAKRETFQTQIRKFQNDLNRLFRYCPNRPRDTLTEIDQRIAKLEHQRTITSIPLSQEKQILKQIYKLERSKRQVEEFLQYDEQIKAQKTQVSQLRDNLRAVNTDISFLRVELSSVRTAIQLGCRFEDLLGMKVACPKDKLGRVIGKKGKHVQQLASHANVTVDIDRNGNGDVRIIGAPSSLDQAVLDLDKVISKTEERLSVPVENIHYWTAKGITALGEIRNCHPDVYIDVSKNRSDHVMLRGIPADIASARQDLLDTTIAQQVWQVTNKEGSLVVGKQGSTIEGLVISHQTAIDLQRGDDSTTIQVTGPSGHVQSAMREIQNLVEANKEIEKTLTIDPNIKATLLMESGKGIHALYQKVNNAIEGQGAGLVSINFSPAYPDVVVFKGRARVLDEAIETVQSELHRLEHTMIRLQVDPVTIPVLIGKKGQAVKNLKDGRAVNIEFEHETGKIIVCGLEESDVKAVVEHIKAMASNHEVERISLDPSQYTIQVRDLLRAKAKEINSLVHVVADDAKSQVLLRGTKENLAKATALVQEHISNTHVEELEVTDEDMSALLTGGKESKIVEFATETGVQLNSIRDRKVIVAKGKKENVSSAFKTIRSFLYGGEGMSLTRIPLDSDVFGIVIGKGGKTKAAFQKRFSSLSIVAHRHENVITLRGPENDVEACRTDILTLIATARITKTLELSKTEIQKIENSKFHRRIMQTFPVQISIKESLVTVRGLKDDVRHVAALVLEHVGRVYEVGYYMDSSLYRKIKETWRDPSNIQRIETTSGAKINLKDDKSAILFSGKRFSVQKAKQEVLKFLGFSFSSMFCRLDLSEPVLVSLGRSDSISQAVACSGAQVLLDRDIMAILILSSDLSRVQKAKVAMQLKIDSESKLIHVIQLEDSEDWLVSSILGKNGKRIKSLRKETGCKIEVASRERRLTISADNEDLIAKAKATIDEIISKARRECVFVNVPEVDMAAFVGKSGSHINEFAAKHGVQVQIMKKGTNQVRLTGKEQAVEAAQNSLSEWIAGREEKRREETAENTIPLHRNQLSLVIGGKGTVIRGLEREFGCKIDVNRRSCVVTVRGAKRAQAVDKILKIANEEPSDKPENEADNSTPHPSEAEVNSRKEMDTGSGRKATKSDTLMPLHRVQKSPIQASDFPALGECEEGAIKSTSNAKYMDRSWASVLIAKTTATENMSAVDRAKELQEPQETDDTIPFLGDIDETNTPTSPVSPVATADLQPLAVVVSEEAWDATSVASEDTLDVDSDLAQQSGQQPGNTDDPAISA